MKNEDQAWRQLHRQAADRLGSDFARRVLRQARGADTAAWARLHAHGAAQLRPGFAERVLRLARDWAKGPSLWDQFALCVATATVCLLGVLFVADRDRQHTEQANLATWVQLADEVQDIDVAR